MYYWPFKPEAELLNICREAGVECVELRRFGKNYRRKVKWRVGKNVVYATYDGFIFAINTGEERAFISFPGRVEAVFPEKDIERQIVYGRIYLQQSECVFLFDNPG